ncbi:MAG: hypothetical protein COB41_00040 [Proteobacteria bacterium]|nr:MAG: hypothetical protein COB41_00040 [Pseudomonadota bacterium]
MSERDLTIDLDIKQEDMQTVFDVTEFLEVNKKTILSDMKPYISEFLRNEAVFRGPFALAFDDQFKEVVEGELKTTITETFNLDPEKAMYLIEMVDLMGILDYFLDKGKYLE